MAGYHRAAVPPIPTIAFIMHHAASAAAVRMRSRSRSSTLAKDFDLGWRNVLGIALRIGAARAAIRAATPAAASIPCSILRASAWMAGAVVGFPALAYDSLGNLLVR